jgi:hypothetical protein
MLLLLIFSLNDLESEINSIKKELKELDKVCVIDLQYVE